jgi:aminoglycoside 6'-N-acetyltransferase I
MTKIEDINETNIQKLAELSVELWPDCDLSEMTVHYERIIKSNMATCFLIRDELNYFGFIELSVRNDYVEGAEEVPVAYIEGLFVNVKYRLKGFGLLLIQKAEDWALTKGFKQLCSDTEEGNKPSIGFHTSAGFTEISRIVCFAKSLTKQS